MRWWGKDPILATMSDENSGGNGENGLHEMLMRTIGREIILLPALPGELECEVQAPCAA
jgi:hypothetical protein